jgi:type I restriction enzyme S subunit
MSSYRPYPKYKPSGVEWLGDVPEGWEVSRIKNVATINASKSEVSHLDPETEISFLPMEAVGDDGSLDASTTRQLADVLTCYTYVRENDVLVAKITPCFENGKGCIARGLNNGIGFATTEVVPIRPNKRSIPEFLYFLLHGLPFRKVAEGSMYGAGGQKRVSDTFVAGYSFALPPLPEQQQIAAFLDRECGKLDALQAKQERLIELLKEKRQALISHAVTRGLDPTAKLKPSGVEWLGEVPEHWEIEKLWWHFGAEKGKDTQRLTKEFCMDNPGECPVYSGQTANEGVMGLIDHYDYDEGERGGLFATTVGAKAMELKHLTARFSLSQNCMIIRPRHSRFDIRFYLHHFTPLFYFERQMIPDHMQPSFRVEDLLGYRIAIPPLAEQRAIVAHLDEKCWKIDQLKAKAERGIELLKERRSALISAAVTGKIDVRESIKQTVPA